MKDFYTDIDLKGHKLQNATLNGAAAGKIVTFDANGLMVPGDAPQGGGAQAQADWNQTNAQAADFIKNKPEIQSYTTMVMVDNDENKKLIVIPRYEHGCGDNVVVICSLAGSNIAPDYIANESGDIVLCFDGTSYNAGADDQFYYTNGEVAASLLSRVPLYITVYRLGKEFMPALNWAAYKLAYLNGVVAIIRNSFTPRFYEGMDDYEFPDYAGNNCVLAKVVPKYWMFLNDSDAYVGWPRAGKGKTLIIPEKITLPDGTEIGSDDFTIQQNYAYNYSEIGAFIFLAGHHSSNFENIDYSISAGGSPVSFDYAGEVRAANISSINTAGNVMKAFRLSDDLLIKGANAPALYYFRDADLGFYEDINRWTPAATDEPDYLYAGSYIGVCNSSEYGRVLIVLTRSDIHPFADFGPVGVKKANLMPQQ